MTAQIRELVLDISDEKIQVFEFVLELAFAEKLYQNFLSGKCGPFDHGSVRV